MLGDITERKTTKNNLYGDYLLNQHQLDCIENQGSRLASLVQLQAHDGARNQPLGLFGATLRPGHHPSSSTLIGSAMATVYKQYAVSFWPNATNCQVTIVEVEAQSYQEALGIAVIRMKATNPNFPITPRGISVEQIIQSKAI